MSTLYSVGQMNQLGDALEAAGFTPDDVTKLRSFVGLADLKKVLKGQSQIIATEHVIDCDADPFVPKGWKVESHKKGGPFKWDVSKVSLYLSEHQKGDKYIQGHKLKEELANQPVLNANVLDYLLKHPELILEEWKGRAVFFWGTVYRDSDGDLYVRYLHWYGDRWDWYYRWLVHNFNRYYPAACSQV